MKSIFETAPAAARWPRYQHVIFDCDSTLSTIEGIDELCEQPETRQQIVDLTHSAMEGIVPLDSVYGQRLSLIAPTQKAVRELAVRYRQNIVTDARRVVSALLEAGCEVYIVSGGLLEPVREFGISLGVDARNIRAVELDYDQLGDQWWRADLADEPAHCRYHHYQPSDLVVSDGKVQIIEQLLAHKPGASLLVGDGISDLMARNAVDLFVGYGGVVTRAQVRAAAPVFLESASLLPMLALALGDAAFHKLEPAIRGEVLAELRASPPVFNRQVLARSFGYSFLLNPQQ